MKKIYQVLLATAIAAISIKCQKELSGDHTIPTHANQQSSPITITLQGNVLDENGVPANGVAISAGSKTTATNAHGYFRIADALLDRNSSLVTAEMPGYFKACRTFRATTGVNQVVIQLIKKALSGTVNASTGGEVSLVNGAKVALASNGIVKSTGAAYTGVVNVYAAYIDPTSREIGKTVPGSFMADDKDNNRTILSSYGMMAVELESPAGEKLQIASGSTATLTIPIPTGISSSAPASISLWYTDEQSGIWKEQGTAKKNGSNYTGEVKHFSYWNCDISSPAIGFSATFTTPGGLPLTNVSVKIGPVSDSTWGYAHGYTDSLGQAAGLIPANTNLVLEVFDQCYDVIFSRNIGPFTENTDLGTIVIPNSIPSVVTVKGKLLSCSNTPVTEGYAIIYWNNFASYVNADADGKFSTDIVTCSGSPVGFEILGVDATTQQQGHVVTVPVNGQVADAGIIIACGNSTVQFINYTLDGTDHNLSNPADSLIAYDHSNGTSIVTQVMGSASSPATQLVFDFTSNGEAGVYPLNSLRYDYHERIQLIKPFNITITAFPQHSGEYYEGNFSGRFIDSSTVPITHDINCSFRVRKY